MVSLASSSRPSLRGRVLVRLPATLQATGGLKVEKVSGVWTFAPDWSVLTLETSLPNPSSREIWVRDSESGQYSRLSIQALYDNFEFSGRELLTSNRTYYVRPDGSDSNTGLANTAGGAFLTQQKAINTACALDLATYSVAIQCADGTYTTPVTLRDYVGFGPITLQGNVTTPANCLISTTSASCINGSDVAKSWVVTGFKFQTTTLGSAFNLARVTGLSIGRVDFGAMASGYLHVNASQNSFVSFFQPYTISGSAAVHWNTGYGSTIWCPGLTVTLTGTPTFSYFAQATELSKMIVNGNTFVGSATAIRYNVSGGSLIQSGGGGASYLPGNVNGTTSTGGQYV